MLEANGLEGSPSTFVMVARTVLVEITDRIGQSNPSWNLRLRYPVMEPSDPVTVGMLT